MRKKKEKKKRKEYKRFSLHAIKADIDMLKII